MQIKTGLIKEAPKHGLIDGPHHYLECSNCGAMLCDIWSVKPPAENDVSFTFIAKCPYCQDRSFPMEVKGLFYLGGLGLPNPNDSDDEIQKTRITRQHNENDYVILDVIDTLDGKPMTKGELLCKLKV